MELAGQRTDVSVQEKLPSTIGKSITQNNTIPPPLPPRNIDNHGIISFVNNPLRYFANNTNPQEKFYGHYDNVESNHRKTKTRLYERLTDHRKIDSELFDFYIMVKNVRQKFPYDNYVTNIGHIIASEFNYHYPADTNIKILVYPSLDILSSNAESKCACKVPFKGYGKPVIFTCDSTYNIQ